MRTTFDKNKIHLTLKTMLKVFSDSNTLLLGFARCAGSSSALEAAQWTLTSSLWFLKYMLLLAFVLGQLARSLLLLFACIEGVSFHIRLGTFNSYCSALHFKFQCLSFSSLAWLAMLFPEFRYLTQLRHNY